MGLQINISKTKYMFSTKNKSQSQLTCSLTLGSRKFEVVKELTKITADNKISAEIRRRITLVSRIWFIKTPPLENAFNVQRLRWLGHIVRMNDANVAKRVFEKNPEGR